MRQLLTIDNGEHNRTSCCKPPCSLEHHYTVDCHTFWTTVINCRKHAHCSCKCMSTNLNTSHLHHIHRKKHIHTQTHPNRTSKIMLPSITWKRCKQQTNKRTRTLHDTRIAPESIVVDGDQVLLELKSGTPGGTISGEHQPGLHQYRHIEGSFPPLLKIAFKIY